MYGFCPLGSGSKGNSIFFGTKQKKILIDAGLSGRAIKERLSQIQVDIQQIDAILITHEHVDHIQGLKVLALKHQIPVLANQETAKGIVEYLHDYPKFKIFTTGETFEYGDMEIHPFSIQHDTLDPVAFTIKVDGLKMGFCTDLGFATTLVRSKLKACDYLYLEANHQPELVHASLRPHIYKQRVLGRLGHLSNLECGHLLNEICHSELKHVHLAHLSSECNSPELALKQVSALIEHEGRPEISVALQSAISRPVFFARSPLEAAI
jgi:phosphoribosyl 1,2-cyclic phosphodiesterase